MTQDIRRIAVLGAGLMGAQIAGHAAGAGLEVLLFDLKAKDGAEPCSPVLESLAKLKKAKPSPLFSERVLRAIRPCNYDDDLALLSSVDLVIEAVVEDLKIKHKIYESILPHLGPQVILASNTSTIPLKVLASGLPDSWKSRFFITHFFNPPRYMPLLEIVQPEQVDAEAFASLCLWGDKVMGKDLVQCFDTPGFIANRIGTYWMQTAINEVVAAGLSVDQADHVLSQPFGIPKTGVFGLLDMIGLDLMPKIFASFQQQLPATDPMIKEFQDHSFLKDMLATGYVGRKGKGGFYALDAQKNKQSRNLITGQYVRAQKFTDKLRLDDILHKSSPAHDVALRVYIRVVNYALSLLGIIAPSVYEIDRAMISGYGWKFGIFGLLSKIDSKALATRLQALGLSLPKELMKPEFQGFYQRKETGLQALGPAMTYIQVAKKPEHLLLQDLKDTGLKPLLSNPSAAVYDVGDAVLLLELRSKMNTFDPLIFELIHQSIALIKDKAQLYKALVLYGERDVFSAGANLGLASLAINTASWGELAKFVQGGQEAFMALKYAPFPFVAAVSGMALGGGCEVILHADHVVGHVETYMGLVELGVGLIPGWGGCKEMIIRASQAQGPKGPVAVLQKAFDPIAQAKVSSSLQDAVELGYLDPARLTVVMNKERLLTEAKDKALALAQAYAPPVKKSFKLSGESGQAAVEVILQSYLAQGLVSAYDADLARKLAFVLSGGNKDMTEEISEDELLLLEQSGFADLLKNSKTWDRIEHMVDQGKALRN